MRTNATPNDYAAIASSHRQKRVWLTAVICLAALVVLGTIAALMMPASAMTAQGEATPETALAAAVETETTVPAETTADAIAEQATAETAALPQAAQVPEGYTVQRTVRDEENGFAVTVYAPEGVIQEDAVLCASLLSQEDEKYQKASEELAEQTDLLPADAADSAEVKSQDAESDTETPAVGFAALDIHFEDADGNEVEPNGEVFVSIDAAGLIPEDADPESVTVQHHEELDDEAVVVETVADTADETEGVVEVTPAEETASQTQTLAETPATDVQAAFAVDNFSTFTITWEAVISSVEINVECFDSVTKISLPDGFAPKDIPVFSGTSVEFSANNEELAIEGYTFKYAKYSTDDGETWKDLTDIKADYHIIGRYWTFSFDGHNSNRSAPAIRLYYQKDNQGGGSSGDDKVKVYVYVAGNDLADECFDLLGIDPSTKDQSGYFPAGEIELDASWFDEKGFDTEAGAGLISDQEDWQALLAALGKMDTSTLVDQRNSDYPGLKEEYKLDYSKNRNNHVGDYIEQAAWNSSDANAWWGTMRTTLFHWWYDSSIWGNGHYGFDDQTVEYHLDLRFTTNTITFKYGDNGITRGEGQDGTQAAQSTYITGSEIQEPDGIAIPNGWYFAGYYKDRGLTKPWNEFGEPLTSDETVYIKLTKEQVMTLSVQKEIEIDTTVASKTYAFTIATDSESVKGKSYVTSNGENVVFSTSPNDDGKYTATVSLEATKQNGIDGTVLIYGLPANSGNQKIQYTVTENTESANISGYSLTVTYSNDAGESSNTVTASGSSSTASSSVLTTNSYEEQENINLTLKKVDEDNKPLVGAQFQLKNAVNQYYTINNNNGNVVVTWSSSPYTLTSANNTFAINDLPDGTYTLTETKAPDGYQMLTNNITITVNEGHIALNGTGAREGDDDNTIVVTNSTGVELPETGGTGTTAMTIGGLLLLAAAAGGYELRRRRGRGAK